MNFKKVFCFSLCLFFSISSWSKTINITSIDWAPFYGSKLEKDGVSSEIARQALKRAGYTVKFHYMPWKRAMSQTAKGKKYHALFGCWHNKEREKKFVFSKETMMDGSPHFLASKDSNLSISKPEDLNGLTIGIVRGYAISDPLKKLFKSKKSKRFHVNDKKSFFNLIKKKRVDIVMDNIFVIQESFKKKFPGQTFNLKKVGSDFFNGQLYMCWSKKYPGIQKLVEEFDNSLKAMKADGSVDKIKKEFGF